VCYKRPTRCIASPTNSLYATCFNDVIGGRNPKNATPGTVADDPSLPSPPNGFPAVAGYDLVTGLGSPTCTLIAQLASPTPLIPIPIAQPAPPGSFAGVGPADSCGVISGAVECWGNNSNGQDGNGSINPQPSPGCVSDLTGFAPAIQVAEGSAHSCVLFGDGGVWCWGDNSYGQLGQSPSMRANSYVPVDMNSLSSVDQGNFPIQIAAGGNVTCVVLGDGSVWCWGQNDQGQLGQGMTNGGATPTPVQPVGLPPASQVAVSTAGTFVCALLQSGNVDCWGANTYGQLGNPGLGIGTGSSTPQAVGQFGSVSQIAAGDSHVCAVVPTGQPGAGLWCWGDDSESELGEGPVVAQGGPAQQPNPTLATQVSGCTSGCPPPVNVVNVACGGKFTCVLLKNGSVECWGDDTSGELGNGTSASTPVSSPVVASGLSGVTSIVAGPDGACAQVGGVSLGDAGSTGGAIWCWGAGPVGNGTTGSAKTPTQATFSNTCM
jgi:alpha-tubulin suppressor-like RCC1 family protein